MTQDEIKKPEPEEEEEEEEEPIFVLTDEWKEFFAKSEARRRLGLPIFTPFSCFPTTVIGVDLTVSYFLHAAKKQAKKKGKA